MKTQHTPGPWSHIEDYGTPDGTPLRLVKSEREEIAFYVSEANAALIAAAPELLAAAQSALSALEALPPLLSGRGDRNESTQAELRAAIAQAVRE